MIEITKDFILKRISQEEIFCYYTGEEVNLQAKYTNHRLRKDATPGCKYYYSQSGVLLFNDFSWRKFNCFDYVMQLYSVNFYTSLKIIANDFKLSSYKVNEDEVIPKAVTIKKENELRIKRKNHSVYELKYWRQYIEFITEEDLIKWKIYALKKAWFNNYLIYDNRELAFVYHVQEGYHYQLYFPNREDNRFRSTGNSYVQCWEMLPETGDFVVITKSRKDCFLLSFFGIPAISIMNEKLTLPPEKFFELEVRFKTIYTLFDNDYTGKRCTVVHKQKYGTTPLLFPKNEPKDFGDNLLHYGYHYINDLINEVSQSFSY